MWGNSACELVRSICGARSRGSMLALAIGLAIVGSNLLDSNIVLGQSDCPVGDFGSLRIGETEMRHGRWTAEDCMSFSSGGPLDMYRFSVTTPATVLIELSSADASLYLASGTVGGIFASSDNVDINDSDALIEVVVAADKQYWVYAWTRGRDETGSYTLTVQVAAIAGRNDYGTMESEDLMVSQPTVEAICPEIQQLFRVTQTTSTTPVLLTRPARLDTDCQVDGFRGGVARPADRYEFTLHKPARVSFELSSSAFEPHVFVTDATGEYPERGSARAPTGVWLSLAGSRAADGDGDAIIRRASGQGRPLPLPASLPRLHLEPGTYWLFAVSESGSRTGDYQIEVEYERIADSELLDQQIAERFAPIILFEQDEDHFPVPVDLMVDLSTLHYTKDGQAHTKLPGSYGLVDLVSYNGMSSYLDLPDDNAIRRLAGQRVVYAHVGEGPPQLGGTLVQYWFFYLYNDTGIGSPLADHEGDWEGVQLWFPSATRQQVLNADGAEVVGYAAHESGYVARRRSLSCDVASQRVPVYVARNRHASYPVRGGRSSSYDLSKDTQDQFHGNGSVWTLDGTLDGVTLSRMPGEGQPRLTYEIRLLPVEDGSWFRWDGRWGEQKGGDLLSASPRGPAFKSHFWTPPEFNFHWERRRFCGPW